MSLRRRTTIRLLLASAPAALLLCATHDDAHAQSAGTTNVPLPNVMLLIDTSGSMERMPDSSMPSEDRVPGSSPAATIATAPFNHCTPGQESNPNRWGMLVQALTGNMQPFYSCAEMSRKLNTAFHHEYKINDIAPYDTGYLLPYHRPLTGAGLNACAFAPDELPGAPPGSGVGPARRGSGGDARDFPATAFTSVRWNHLSAQYAANNPISPAGNACVFEQALDGQLDATRDYVRFSLMTFDTDTGNGQGVTVSTPPSGNVDTTSPFAGLWSYRASSPPVPGVGLPSGCAPPALPFDVGARHWAAPPWEGRHVPFTAPQGSLYDVQRTNDEIQKVILATRPFGATPIDGLVEDARDYLWRSTFGPNGTISGYEDPYVKSGCRDSYIILLTDGAPNLNMRPGCGAGTGTGGGICPYPVEAYQNVQQMWQGAGGPKVTTYVIGFSVNGSGAFPGDGFPGTFAAAPSNNCKAWYVGPAPEGGGGTPQGMENACAAAKAAGKAPPGSTADACCQLNKIAFHGTGAGPDALGAFFAETQADLVLSFGRILANISKSATSRTPPAYSPVVSIAGEGVSAKYVTSFIPNARKPWSGEIDRTRASCSTSPPGSDLPQSADTGGDSYAQNTAAQAAAGTRFFISVKGDTTSGSIIDSARTMRPYTSATTYDDGIPEYRGVEVGAVDMGLANTGGWTEAMDIDANTCKRSRAVSATDPSQTVTVPRLSAADCRDVVWNFTTASKQSALKTGPEGSYEFNVRCRGAAGLSAGTCSITGSQTCTVGVANTCPIGEVCVPECAALGAIYHSTPAVVGPPSGFLREDSFRQFQEGRALRRPAMFVASTDGVLHAFKALETQGGAQGGNGKTENWEMWAFVPPAVLPKLASNYPTGQQLLLDGSPVVKDTVWDRASIGNADQWHTTLVAGMGSGHSGYYALNVTDADCGSTCNTPGTWQSASSLADASIGGLNVAKRGPHFLWQITDIPKQGADNGIVVRSAKGTIPTEMVALFGKQSGTPAIATVRADPDGTVAREIGVAILPGGIDGPPVKGASCPRGIASGYPAVEYDRSDAGRPPRTEVRRWANACTGAAGRVAGRGVTIVRLDTGEIIRHFGRLSVTPEVPAAIVAKTNDTPFDSPMVGTPAVYPAGVGQTAQRVFVGDADGTIWSIDLTSTDPTKWKATIFQDLFSGEGFAASQPVSVPLVVSQDPGGAIVVNAATGDQENITASALTNYVYSIREAPSFTLAIPSRSEVRWLRALPNGERVTGPMVVFDRILYFATHLPDPLSAVCGAEAKSRLWGLDYLTPDAAGVTAGGLPRWCPRISVDPISGLCGTGGYQPFEDITEASNSIIPGVTLRPTLVCTQFGAVPEDPTGGITGITPQRYELFFSFSKPATSSGTNTPTASRLGVTVPVPRISAMIDAWSLVFD
jgi:type IV pilus assembly protein PilY1